MIIKPDGNRPFLIPLVMISMIALLLVEWRTLPIVVCMIVYMVLDSIVTWKTIIMDENGCTLKLFSYERKYEWNKISVIRKEKYSGRYPYYPHKEAMFFSVKPVKKPKWMEPLMYCSLKHPFVCFYLYLVDEKTMDYIQSGKFTLYTTDRLYVVDKKKFLDHLKEWGVSYTE